jgi:hypothetical protein
MCCPPVAEASVQKERLLSLIEGFGFELFELLLGTGRENDDQAIGEIANVPDASGMGGLEFPTGDTFPRSRPR